MPAHPDAMKRAESRKSQPLTMTGYAATWDLDLGGDVIMPGAFTKTLSDWHRTGRVIPLIDMHDYSSIFKVIGTMTSAKEDDHGLLCRFDLIEGSPDAQEVVSRLKGGHIRKLSIGYKAVRTRAPDAEGYAAGIRRFLMEADLEEVSCVIWPMNDAAEIVSVGKARELSGAQMKSVRESLDRLSRIPAFKQLADARHRREMLETIQSLPEIEEARQRREERERAAAVTAARRKLQPTGYWGAKTQAPRGRIPGFLR